MRQKTIEKGKFSKIRTPKPLSWQKTAGIAVLIFFIGIALGIFSKWLDNLSLDSSLWWHRIVETLDLGNFFSDIAIWLLAALIIAVFSYSALRAALNVFLFFAGMCSAYHLYTILFSGFNPSSYMLIWFGITLVSPFLAILCWYAKGRGIVPVIFDILIIAVFALACFGLGLFYVTFRGVLYLLVFIAACIVMYRSPKQMLTSLPIGIILAFLLSPLWPFR